MLLLTNTVQTYPWGRIDGLASLVGSEPSGGPEAELWVGTHPGAPSMVADDPRGRSLADVIAADPVRWLGEELAGAGHTALPFLLKVLAVGSPLSLQAHPSAEQAAAGFAREEAAGVPLDAAHRTYRDQAPKPEALVALTDTWALCGFRDPEEAAELVGRLEVPALGPLLVVLDEGGSEALRGALRWLLNLRGSDADAVVTATVDAARREERSTLDDPLTWVARLSEMHPGDATVLAPLLSELVHLAPGQAVHLPAGNLHAYLDGAGVEIMQASDNVLRGGLTPKHVDVAELLEILVFEPGVPPAPVHEHRGDGVETFDVGEEAFALALVTPDGGEVEIGPEAPSLLLATNGRIDLAGEASGLTLEGGDAAFVAPGEGPIAVSGPGRLWWATSGDGLPG